MSMRVHRYHMNGRLAAHTLVQIFGMLPAWLFDIVNSIMYILQIALLHRISKGHEQRSNGILIFLFCGAWLFCPAFGQVNLWQDGSCNYLWSGVFALLYLLPFIELYLKAKEIHTIFEKCIFLCLAFCMGAYSETVSAAAIFMAAMLVLLTMVSEKRKVKPFWFAALGIAFLGYLFIYTAPAQWREKSAQMKFSVLLNNFLSVAVQYWNLLSVLLVICGVVLIWNLLLKTERKTILLALVFLAGSLAANFIMLFANYYTDRSAVGAFVFLLGAVGILLYPLVKHSSCRRILAVGVALILLAAIPAVVSGVSDIYNTYQNIRANEAYIIQCAEEGIQDIAVPMFDTETKYSELSGLKYLDTELADEWPNDSMAKYYGVNSIIGVYAE